MRGTNEKNRSRQRSKLIFSRLSPAPPQNRPIVSRESLSRQSANRFADFSSLEYRRRGGNRGNARGPYAFNRIVNSFLFSVHAEQLENCMQMQKYSGERPGRDFLSIRDIPFHCLPFSLPIFHSRRSSLIL